MRKFILTSVITIAAVAIPQPALSAISTAEDLITSARKLNQEHQSSASAAVYRQFLSLQPQDTQARLELAELLSYSAMTRTEAIAEFDVLLSQHPEMSSARFERAMTLAWMGNYAVSIPELQALNSRDQSLSIKDIGSLPVEKALAEVYTWSNQKTKAKPVYESYLQSHPSDAGARREYAELLSYDQDTRAAAVSEFDKVMALDKDNKLARFERAMTLSFMKQYPEALTELRALAKDTLLEPDVTATGSEAVLPVGIGLAEVTAASGDNAQSEIEYRNYLKIRPDDNRALIGLAVLLTYHPNERQEAIATLVRTTKLDRNEIEGRLALANAWVWSGNRKDAGQELTDLAQAHPENFAVQKELALFLLPEADKAKTLEQFERAGALAHEADPEFANGMGTALLNLGRTTEAKSIYESALKSFPDNGDLNFGLAQAYELTGNENDASSRIARALDSNPSADRMAELAAIYTGEKQLRRLAALVYSSMMSKYPQRPDTWLNYGELLSWAPQTRDQGTTYLQGYAQMMPADPVGKQALAEALSWGKQKKKSLALYEDLVREHPADRYLQAHFAEVLSWCGKISAARKIYQQLLVEDATNKDALIGLGECYTWDGDNLKAEKIWGKLASTYPQDFRITVERATNYQAMGRLDLARHLLDPVQSIAKSSNDL